MAALWIGAELPRYGAACLASFATQGHPTTLYSYQPVRGVPSSVATADAASVVGPKIMQRYAAIGRLSQFSNYFRYELLEQQAGICWIDADVYCLAPIAAEPYIFGWQDAQFINGAVLALPSGSAMLTDLRRMFSQDAFIAPWLSRRRLRLHQFMALVGKPILPQNYRWGILGPEAITWFARQYGLEGFAKPKASFYPVTYRDTVAFLDPGVNWAQRFSEETRTVHLWNEFLRRNKDVAVPPRGSLLWKILEGEPLVVAAAS